MLKNSYFDNKFKEILEFTGLLSSHSALNNECTSEAMDKLKSKIKEERNKGNILKANNLENFLKRQIAECEDLKKNLN